MAEATFSADGRLNGRIRIDPLATSAEGGANLAPLLRFQVAVTMQPVEHPLGSGQQDPSPTLQHYTLIQLSGRVSGPGGLIGDFVCGPLLQSSADGERTHPLEILLDPFRVRHIEEQRVGDLIFRLDVTSLLARHVRAPRGQPNSSIEGLTSAWCSLQSVQIPQSHWISLLPGLGCGQVKLVEIPRPQSVIPDTFSQSLTELDRAQADMNQGNYDDVVGHCRTALELITKAVPLEFDASIKHPTFRQKIDKLLDQVSGSLPDPKRGHLATIINAVWGLTSIPEHPHPPGVFNRADAETVMLMTVATLSYTGRLLSHR